MSSIIKVDQIQDSGGNNLVTSNGSGVITSAGFGKIGQIVTATSNTEKSTTSSSFVATGIEVTITPTSTSSKILLLMTLPMYIDLTTAAHAVATIYRGGVSSGTNLGANDFDLYNLYSKSDTLVTSTVHHIDSPSTTSATTYEVGLRRVTEGTAYISTNQDTARLTAMEILP